PPVRPRRVAQLEPRLETGIERLHHIARPMPDAIPPIPRVSPGPATHAERRHLQWALPESNPPRHDRTRYHRLGPATSPKCLAISLNAGHPRGDVRPRRHRRVRIGAR